MDQPANPQLEDGYTRIANEILEALSALQCPASVLRVVLAVIRETYGYNRKTAPVNRARIAAITGWGETRVKQTVSEAVAWRLLVRNGRELGLQKDHTRWSKPVGRTAGFRKDALPEVSEGRPTRFRKDALPETDAAQIGEGEGYPTRKPEGRPTPQQQRQKTERLEHHTTKPDTPQQTAIRDAFERLTGEPLPKQLPGYSVCTKLVAEHGIPIVAEWVRSFPPNGDVPEGANAWEYFKRTFRDAMKRPWEWRRKDTGSPVYAGIPTTAELRAREEAERAKQRLDG